MSAPHDNAPDTCWTIIREAAGGDADARSRFAERYEPIARAYFAARWRGSPMIQELDDALQEAFVESFREGGALERADPDRSGGFRAYLYGVLRNVARRVEQRRSRRKDQQAAPGQLTHMDEPDEQRLSHIFDREWASGIMREAAGRHRRSADRDDAAASRRVELLRLRFHDGLPIREIAERWEADPVHVHREYARARREFRRELESVVAFHHPGTEEQIHAECLRLLAMLE